MMGVVAFVGLLGSGKTLHMVYYCMEEMKRGRKVISNTRISFVHKGRRLEAEYISNAQEFENAVVRATNAIIAIDEAGIVINKRFFRKMSWDVSMKFKQSRKDACMLWYTAQSIQDVASDLKDLTNEIIYCTPRRTFGLFSKLPYIRFSKLHLIIKRFPSFWNRYKKAMAAKTKQETLYYRRGYLNILKFTYREIFTKISAMTYVGYHSNFSRYYGLREPFSAKWWERVRFKDTLYPSTYRAVMQAYNTMLKVNSRFAKHEVVNVETSVAKRKPRKATTPKLSHNPDLISRAEETIAETRQVLRSTSNLN